ncbi:MAG: hypothetical protein RL240_2028, partial [Planctomycetota bacterium]
MQIVWLEWETWNRWSELNWGSEYSGPPREPGCMIFGLVFYRKVYCTIGALKYRGFSITEVGE